MTGNKIRVLIADDSPLVREALKSILSSEPSIEVIGVARNGAEAVDKTRSLRPNVITMDLEMPIMGGIEAIKRIMEEIPTPIVVVSSLDPHITIKALAIGAMDFVSITDDIELIAENLIEKIRIASRVRPMRRINISKAKLAVADKQVLNKKLESCKDRIGNVVAIGVSTGGPQALQLLFSALPKGLPVPLVVVQHISRGFIKGLVEWLRSVSNIDVKVAESGETLKCSTAYFAPDDYHISIEPDGRIALTEDMGRHATHVPSIDIMMQSVASSYGDKALGVIMTGMGKDGVRGISEIKKAGGFTIAQDESSSIIFGMNKIAIESNCIDRVVSLEDLPGVIVRYCAEERI